MSYIAPINKKDKQAAIIGAIILLILLFLILFFTSMKQADPPYPTKEVIMVMDFTDAGGGSAGGSKEVSEETSESAKEQNEETNESSEDEASTQEEESAVTAESQTEASSSDGNGEADEQEAKYDLGNVYGSGGGEEGSNGEGGSDGGTGGGDGLGNGEGVGDGSSRKIKNVPVLDNLTNTPAKVAVKIKINKDGEVYWSEAQLSNSFTNTSDKTIIELAEKKALEFTYKPTSASAEYDVKTLKLEFKVN